MMAIGSSLLSLALAWPVLAVAVPLAVALTSALLGRVVGRLAVPAALAGLLIAVLATAQVVRHGVVEINLGGWPPPLGIALRVDGLSCAFLLATALVVTAAIMWAQPDFRSDRASGETREGYVFWPLVFLLVAALNAVSVAGDLFNLYVALELLTVTAVALVSLHGTAAGVAAAIRYLLFALLGSLAYLLGAALLYSGYATLDLRLLAPAVRPDAPTVAAGALMSVGLMAKMALFPLHVWLPPAHAAAPAPASAVLSALVVKAPFLVLLRLWFEAFPSLATGPAMQILGTFGAGGILVGSLLAFRQERLKLVVAYSTIAQLGYLALMFPLAGGSGEQQPWVAGAWSGAVFHALAHALAKAAMFLAVGAMVQGIGHDRLDGLVGIGQHLPVATFAFGLAALSLMGLPPSGGFTGKYLLLTSAFASGQWWWAVVMIGGGLLAAAYLFRPMNCFLAGPVSVQAVNAVPRTRQLLALALAALSVLLGLLSAGPYQLLQIGRSSAAEEGLG